MSHWYLPSLLAGSLLTSAWAGAQANPELRFLRAPGLFEATSWSPDGLVKLSDVTDSPRVPSGEFADLAARLRNRPTLANLNACLTAFTTEGEAHQLRQMLAGMLRQRGYRKDLALAGLLKVADRVMRQGSNQTQAERARINELAHAVYATLKPHIAAIKRADAPLYLSVAYAAMPIGTPDDTYRSTLRAIVDRAKPNPRLNLFVARFMVSPYSVPDGEAARHYLKLAAAKLGDTPWVAYVRLIVQSNLSGPNYGRTAAKSFLKRSDLPPWMRKVCARYLESGDSFDLRIDSATWRGQ